MKHSDFLRRYQPHLPYRAHLNSDELRLLGTSDGVLDFLIDDLDDQRVRRKPSRHGDDGCHLWVLNKEGIPYLLERGRVAVNLDSGMAKHTNLTRGGRASCGGEVWFDPDDETLLYLNGCSGRYGPRTARELSDVEEVFEDLGFDVMSFGWDSEAGRPAVVLRCD